MRFKILTSFSYALLICAVVRGSLTDAEKKKLLELHKNARDALNSPNMKELKWDDTIAESAQNYANSCKGIVKEDSEYGENMIGYSRNDITKMFNSWLSEKQAFDESGYRAGLKDSYYNNKSIGSYAQIVKARNSKVGCGYNYCRNLGYYILDCRYEIPNYLNEEVYAEPGTDLSLRLKLSDTQKETLIKLHKQTREAVNSPNMKEISWDEKLAESAQEYVSGCYGMITGSTRHGENFAGNISGNVVDMFNQWLDEKKAFEESGYRANLESSVYNGKVISNYAQVVKAKNTKFGCGYSYCENLPYLYLLSCRYEVPNYLNEEVYAEPGTIINYSITEEQKKILLNLHKQAREAVNAVNMKDISWDDTIAKSAQEYANECNGLMHGDSEYGENIVNSSSGDVTDMFNEWMEEKELFDESGYRASLDNTYYKDKYIGHYSQIVKASNTKIGCGYTYCENLYYSYVLVCRYDIPNFLNDEVYADQSSIVSTTVQPEPQITTTISKSKIETTVKSTTIPQEKTTDKISTTSSISQIIPTNEPSSNATGSQERTTDKPSSTTIAQVEPTNKVSSTSTKAQVEPTNKVSSTSTKAQVEPTNKGSSTSTIEQVEPTNKGSSTSTIEQVEPTNKVSSTTTIEQVEPTNKVSSTTTNEPEKEINDTADPTLTTTEDNKSTATNKAPSSDIKDTNDDLNSGSSSNLYPKFINYLFMAVTIMFIFF